MGLRRRSAWIGMPEKTFGGRTDARGGDFADRDERNGDNNAGNSGRGAYVRGLAKTASCFFLAVGVSVRGDLQQEDEGNQS